MSPLYHVLRALRIKKLLTCQRALHAYVLTCQCAFRAEVLMYQSALRSHVLKCQRALRAYVITYQPFLACLRASVPCELTCFSYSCAHVPTYLECLGDLPANMP